MNAPVPDVQMFDVTAARQPDGAVRLTQLDYAGEETQIVLHLAQLGLIADSLGLLGTHDRRIERMVRTVANQLDGLVELILSIQESEYDHIEPEVILRALDLLDLVRLLAAEFADAPPCHEKEKPCHGNSPSISVTSTKRGRPAKEGALTPTERQRRRREKQGESLPLELEATT